MSAHRLPLRNAHPFTSLFGNDPEFRRPAIPQPDHLLNRTQHLAVAQRLQGSEVEGDEFIELRGRAVDAEMGYVAHVFYCLGRMVINWNSLRTRGETRGAYAQLLNNKRIGGTYLKAKTWIGNSEGNNGVQVPQAPSNAGSSDRVLSQLDRGSVPQLSMPKIVACIGFAYPTMIFYYHVRHQEEPQS